MWPLFVSHFKRADLPEASLTKLLVTHAHVAGDRCYMFSRETMTMLVWSLLLARGRVPRDFRDRVREFFESFAELSPLPSELVYTMNHLRLLCNCLMECSPEIDEAAWGYMAQQVATSILNRARASGAAVPPRPRPRPIAKAPAFFFNKL